LIFGLVRGTGAFTPVIPTFVLVSRIHLAQRYRGNATSFSATSSRIFRISRLLTSSFSLGVPSLFCRTTQCVSHPDTSTLPLLSSGPDNDCLALALFQMFFWTPFSTRLVVCINNSPIYHVQDPPDPPSDILHLSPLTRFHSAITHNMELPQSGESRPVLPPSQRTISCQFMRS
jgi:hypothetical protein